MKIDWNGWVYNIPREQEAKILEQVYGLGLQEYEKLDPKWRLAGKAVAREVLRKMEDDVRKKHGKDAALAIRPPKKSDPVPFLADLLARLLLEGLSHVTLAIDATADTIEAFSLSIERGIENPGASGGPVALDGNIGERQNNGAEVPGCSSDEIVSNG